MKPLYKTILLLFLNSPFLVFNCFGQGESNIWYFGNHCGLDFNTGSPVALTNGQTDTREGTATISDAAGNLLFYTDGITVWNRNHLVMPNGTGLMGEWSSTQSATIVPMPGSIVQYYIFTCAEFSNPDSFRYSLVDMTLDSGNGDVTSKNIPLHGQSSEKCVAIYKNGSSDIWVIGHSVDTIFYSYLVTSSGINPPILSFNQPGLDSLEYVIGYMKASPQGNKIAAALYAGAVSNNFSLFDFNCTNGTINNEMSISVTGNLYGLEFSPDGSKLYVFPWGGPPTPIYQYDVTLGTAAAIAASQVIVGNSHHSYLGGAQIGPDQKIYITVEYNDSLSVINNPNMQGTACNFIDDAFYLGGNTSRIGLPALIRGSVCGTTGITDVSGNLNTFQLFPNPSSGIFQITFQSSSYQKTNYTLEVINTLGLGQTVFKDGFSSVGKSPSGGFRGPLDLSFLPKGIYVLQINDGVSALSRKFVIK